VSKSPTGNKTGYVRNILKNTHEKRRRQRRTNKTQNRKKEVLGKAPGRKTRGQWGEKGQSNTA